MPLTNDEIEAAVRAAELVIDRALPLAAVTPDYWPERRELRARAFTEVLREMLGQARIPGGLVP